MSAERKLISEDVPPPVLTDDGRQTLVVVGNGMTSWRLCHELHECGATAELRIVVIGGEKHPAYDRVRLTAILGGTRPEDLLLAGEEWYASAGIELRLGDPVVAIDRDDCLVRTASGAEIFYDRLVLATGSRPFVPPIPGADLPGVFVYRTVDDVHAIRAAARRARRAVVVGGGLLGLEAARAVMDLGLEVTVVEGGPRLLHRQLDEAGAGRLRAFLEGLGVHVVTDRRTAAIRRSADGLSINLDGEQPLEADLIVVAAGVRPAAEVARAAGLELAANGGVCVDDGLMTSDDRVFAVGECASHQGTSYGLVAPGYQMVQVLVANLTGARSRFRPQSPTTKLKVLGLPVSSAGELAGTLSLTFENQGSYRKIVLRRGLLAGVIAVGPWPGFDRVAAGVAARALLSPVQLFRFRRNGELFDQRAVESVVDWPDDAIVCACMGVTRGQIVAACAAGACSVEKIARTTAAGTMCGGCKPLAEQLIQITPVKLRAPSVPPRPRVSGPISISRPPSLPGVPRRLSMPPFHAVKVSGPVTMPVSPATTVLAVAGIVGVILALALAFGPSLPAPTTALGRPIAALLDARPYKLVTGIAAASLAGLSLLLSARKRIRRLASVGTVAMWRAIHGAAGSLSAVAIMAHTGGRLGQNLNLALMLTFLGVIATGGVAGLFRARRLSWLHVIVLWPVPVLLILHILAAVFYA